MKRLLALLWLLSAPALAVPLSTISTFCGSYPDQCRKGTESLMAVRGSGTNAYYVLEANPTTGALPVDASGSTIVVTDASVGPTGSAVPADASYTGLNSGGTLIGAIGDSSGRQVVVGGGIAGTPAGGVVSVQGVASGTAVPISAVSLPLPTGAATAALQPSLGTAGTASANVITVQGIASMTPLLVNGSGSTQPVSGTVAATQSGTWTVQPGNTANTTAWKVDGSAVTQPVSGTVSASNFPATVDTNSGAAGASTIRVIPASGATMPVGRTYGDSVRYTYATAAVTTAAWVQMIASTAAAINCIQLFDSSGQTLELGIGGAGAEVVSLLIPPGGLDGCIPLKIPASSRVSLKALSATTGAIGEFDLTGLN